MSYRVLARKWRPQSFAEVAGQNHVVRSLQNGLDQQRIHHAYLFTGTRGVGKTTLARILAKALNCEQGVSATPCNQCAACLAINAGSFVDLIEVDAASRTKVEDTRDLLDNVQYFPVQGRYKIYLIDEVHMLSNHSFNALLKTLEEPPDHVKFLLATTDPQKLPVTVLSRCLQFNLKSLSAEAIQQQLQKLLQAEGLTYETEALQLLAIHARGSVRDGLSLLDQALAYGANRVVTTEIQELLGIIDSSPILNLLEMLVTANAEAILQLIQQLAESGVDFNTALDKLLEVLHQITVMQLAPLSGSARIANEEERQRMLHLAKQLTPEEIQLYYQIALLGKRDLGLAPTPRTGFELLLLRMLAFRPLQPEPLNEARLPSQPSTSTPDISQHSVEPTRNNEGDFNAKRTDSQPSEITARRMPRHVRYEHAESTSAILESDDEPTRNNAGNLRAKSPPQPSDILAHLTTSGSVRSLLRYCSLEKIEDDQAVILLDPTQAPFANRRYEENIGAALSKYLQRTIQVTIKIGEPGLDTPARREETARHQKLTDAQAELDRDQLFQQLTHQLDGKILTGSLKAVD